MQLVSDLNQLANGTPVVDDGVTHIRECALIPHRNQDPEGFFTSGNKIGRYQAYVSAAAIKDCARQLGWLPGEELDALRDDLLEQIEAQAAEIADLRTKVEAAEELEKARTLVAAADKE